MKKSLLVLICIVFHLSFTNAQDSLIFKTGQRLAVKVDSFIGPFVVYEIPPSKKQLNINCSKLKDIKYGNGIGPTNNPLLKVKDDVVFKDTFDYMPINIDAGIGMSLISLEIPGSNAFGNGGPEILSTTPAYNATIDYRFIRRISIGIGWAYQSVTDCPVLPGDNGYATWEDEQISRYQFSGIFAIHFSKNPLQDAYLGFRAGESVWSEKILYGNDPFNIANHGPPWQTFNQYATSSNFQVFFGYRYFVIYNFGFHFEAGIGSPILIEAGLTYRVKTRKNKSIKT